MMLLPLVLSAVIQLPGVVGEGLRSRAFFDANNVKVGDPLTLTIDFIGKADFKSLHPPALSSCLDKSDWKIYDDSAKTDTYQDARRLTYRVRPMRRGLLWFPGLEFSYESSAGGKKTVKANAIPVHAKGAVQVVVDEMDEVSRLPEPHALLTEPSADLSDDERFAWRKACANPSSEAFLAFDFPAARMNAARMAVLEGNWALALKIYSRLEWEIGQTGDLEKGILAALARKYDDPFVRLPVWREIGRPVLRFAWFVRCSIVVGAFALVAFVFWLLGRLIRIAAVAVIALLLFLPLDGGAQGIFRQMEQEMERMRREMQQTMGGGGFSFSFGGEREERVSIGVSVEMKSDKTVYVGDGFEFVISLEAPRTCSIGQIRIAPSERFGMNVTGAVKNLPDGESKNPSNVVKRLSVPVRYDVPFSGKLAFTVSGMASRRGDRNRAGGFFSFTSSTSFSESSDPIDVRIRALPSAGQPGDYGGIVSSDVELQEKIDLRRPETNDVIQITYLLRAHGYVPEGFLPRGVAFEMNRDQENGIISYRRYFVADGTGETPILGVSYYDPESKTYRRASCGGTKLDYRFQP